MRALLAQSREWSASRAEAEPQGRAELAEWRRCREGPGRGGEGPGSADTHLPLAAAARGRSAPPPPPSLRLPGAGRRLRRAGGAPRLRRAGPRDPSGAVRVIKESRSSLAGQRVWRLVRLICGSALPCQPGTERCLQGFLQQLRL